MKLAIRNNGPAVSPISVRREVGAYEALWLENSASFKSIADRFSSDPTALPSDFVSNSAAEECAQKVFRLLKERGVHRFGVRLHHAGDYPKRLRDARNPVELLYYRGVWELAETRSVAVVGSRKVSPEGSKRTERLVRELVERNFTVVSGLAEGVDTIAHRTAIDASGATVAVVGTPLGSVYPKGNRELQEEIAQTYLLISQIPVLRFDAQDYRMNRFFFPERNATMSALTEATIIVEASDTSGTLTQARAALYQGRKLFILNSCFERTDISWPAKFEAKGAIRVRSMDDIWSHLEA